MRPFLKWAGGKYGIRQHILANLPKGKRLVEPFAGAGSIFLNSHYSQYLLAEKNRDLVDLFQFIQQEGESFIQDACSYFQPENNTVEKYIFYRERFNNLLHQTEQKRERTLLFLYLNKHSYNGLCRYNSRGHYNVPFGKNISLKCPTKRMLMFHQKSRETHTIFEHADFRETMQKARKGDVIYCDPPYVPLTSSFSYVPGEFGTQEQKDLAELAEKLSKKNIPVIVSNHDTPETREYYKNAKIIELSVSRSISCQSNNRKKAQELIAVFGF